MRCDAPTIRQYDGESVPSVRDVRVVREISAVWRHTILVAGEGFRSNFNKPQRCGVTALHCHHWQCGVTALHCHHWRTCGRERRVRQTSSGASLETVAGDRFLPRARAEEEIEEEKSRNTEVMSEYYSLEKLERSNRLLIVTPRLSKHQRCPS